MARTAKKPAVQLTTMKLSAEDRRVIDKLSALLGVGMADCIRIATREALQRRLQDQTIERLNAQIHELTKRRKGAA